MNSEVMCNFLAAVALVFVFEGMMPFTNPQRWKKMLRILLHQSDKTLRIYGFVSMLAGVVLLAIVHQF
jgi:uncharacterized protein YjeT (DUF2065 family)